MSTSEVIVGGELQIVGFYLSFLQICGFENLLTMFYIYILGLSFRNRLYGTARDL
jgi:hypothetical protein